MTSMLIFFPQTLIFWCLRALHPAPLKPVLMTLNTASTLGTLAGAGKYPNMMAVF